MSRTQARAALRIALLLGVTALGGLWRLDALVQKYGPLDRPGWARVLTHRVAPFAGALEPDAYRWKPIAVPFVAGDPINYLKYAREMRSFYQAHVREPVFLALTRGWLWLLGDQDVAVGFASVAGSTLAVLAIGLLGVALISWRAGLAAALLLAGEFEIITWAPDGWRDDTFMAAVLFAAWAFIRFDARPSFANALLVGVTTGLACLTRITALSFVVPGLLWVLVAAPRPERWRRLKAASLAALITAAIVAPYLISCAIATGDPLYAINYHTEYYRYGEGLPSEKPMSAVTYLSQKVAARPIAELDTGATGMFVQPFVTKWNGFDAWLPGLGRTLAGLAIAGLLMLPFSPAGRLLLLILFTSLLPYVFTWNIAGGGEWRFTMHAYPFYILCALYAAVWVWRWAVRVWRERRMPARIAWRRPVAVGAVVAAGTAIYLALPWFVVREAIARGLSVSIETGGRDGAFYGSDWTPPHRDGVIVRLSEVERATVRLPLPVRRAYDIVLRLDPVAPEQQHRASILFNHQFLAVLQLTTDPQRMGSYRLRIPIEAVKRGINELAIVPDTLVPAAAAGSRFAWLHPDQRVGVRLWYVRVLEP